MHKARPKRIHQDLPSSGHGFPHHGRDRIPHQADTHTGQQRISGVTSGVGKSAATRLTWTYLMGIATTVLQVLYHYVRTTKGALEIGRESYRGANEYLRYVRAREARMSLSWHVQWNALGVPFNPSFVDYGPPISSRRLGCVS